jgi:zinc protease
MDVSVWDHPFHDNGLFVTYAFLTPETQPEKVEKLILDEYDSIQKDGVSEKEVARAQSKIRAMTAFSRDGSYSIASHLNEAIAAGDWTLYTTYLERVMEITPEDVQRVAQKYLRESQRTVGHFIPATGSDEEKA